MWYSIKYDNAPMPYAIFFNGGYAIHGTDHVKRLGRPASHGCVRLHPRNAAALYARVRQAGRNNTRISIAH
jgi:lipoprotein-anchoring transpeptidase ErfK/SrfK